MNLSADFNKEEINLHRAIQLLSLTGVNVQKPLPDDSQNTSIWNEKTNTILGRVFELNQNKYQLGIRFNPFELVLLDGNSSVVEFIDIGGLDKPALYSIWEDWLGKIGFKGNLITTLHYDLPENDAYHRNNFDGLTQEFVKSWTKLRSLANHTMDQLNSVSGIKSEINIWPHHFDTGVFYSIKEVNDETTQAIGAGLAIADSMVNEPYFYLYGWSKDGDLDYHNTPKLPIGEWLTGEWQGAVLKASEITSENETNEFFETSYNFIHNQLK